jgi:hypothetical protein
MTKSKFFSVAAATLLAALSIVQNSSLLAQVPLHALHAGERPVGCGVDGILPQQQLGAVLVLTDSCTVKAGTYKFGEVHILGPAGKLTFEDAKIDFWASSILIEKDGALVAGKLDTPIGTTAGSVVTIHLWGKDQTGTDPNKQGMGIACWSDDKAQCGVPDEIWKSNDDGMGMNMPVPPAQAKKIPVLPAPNTYPGVADDYFYAYTPLSFDGATNPTHGVGYFGYKVLALSYGGTLQLYGKKGATYAVPECGAVAPTSSGTSWVRLNADAAKGAQKLVVDRPLSLKKDDQIVVTTTDYLPGHSEQLTVTADVSCGTEIAVNETLQYPHKGTKFPMTGVPASQGLEAKVAAGAETRAAVGVLTRSIRIVSAGDTIDDDFPKEPAPRSTTAGYYFGGHMIARQGFKLLQIQGVEFFQMGQGGKIGHYPVHFHHARRTPSVAPNDTFVRDSSINESMTRWIVLHGTQDVKLERNVGYKSIGHGFYLEDGTEINNSFVANLGVFARAAVDNVQNPRKVPGILAAPNLHATVGDDVPYRSDYQQPTIFWVMNGYNEFRDNMAAGAGTCGLCYWLLPGINSGMSRDMKWSSYASMQANLDRAGMAPLKSFVGNSCTTAMTSFQTITATERCQGIGPGDQPVSTLNLPPIKNPLAPPTKAPDGSDDAAIKAAAAKAADYYPTIGDGGHFSTECTAEDCSTAPVRCSPGNTANCMVTILDHYTTSYNWAAFNFAAIWLRPQWYLVTDSVITDSQQAGLTIVTGGGYSDSDVIPGHWALVRKSVFIGNTQEDNPFASNGGPFNPQSGLRCAADANGSRSGAYCLHIDEGVSHQMSNFGMYQRLFSVYDGPAFQDGNVYLNITKRTIDDCSPFIDVANKSGTCNPKDLSPGKPRQSAWLAGFVAGLPKAVPDPNDHTKDYCYMPNAAIGWKQPNGFYYPPAFHSANLLFKNVEVRHFVVSPLFVEGTNQIDLPKVTAQYCLYSPALFDGFAGNDRQTVLNDDDGSMTGYKNTTVINKDDFFAAPVDATQCRSDNTSRTSPFEYVTTVLYPACVIDGSCARPPTDGPPKDPRFNDGDWNRACTSESCYGIPLWRQDAMPKADKGVAKSIRMMGQETAQRSSLTVNHGTYYFDTSVDKQTQLTQGCKSTDPTKPCLVNVFKASQAYYLFLIYAKTSTEQTYRFYVGDNTDFEPADIQMVQAQIGKNPVVYTPLGKLPTGRAHWLNNNKASANGVVEVVLKLADLPGIDKPGVPGVFSKAIENHCQPATYCAWHSDVNQCQDAKGSTDVCKWASTPPDCPEGGCFGIKFTLPSGFATRPANDPRPNPRPPTKCVANASPWNVSLEALKVSDGTCPVDADKLPEDFCQ